MELQRSFCEATNFGPQQNRAVDNKPQILRLLSMLQTTTLRHATT